MKNPGLGHLTDEVYQTFKKEIPTLYKHFQKIDEEYVLTHFMMSALH